MSMIIPHDIFPYIPHVSTIEMVLKNHQVLMMDLDMLVRGNLDELFQLRRLVRQGEAGGFSCQNGIMVNHQWDLNFKEWKCTPRVQKM